MSSHRWKVGFLNILEHGVTRVSDAAISFILLWALSPEIFSQFALAQAWIGPLLLLFLSPEVVIYRDFAQWKSEGISSLAARVRTLRLFGWGKGQLAIFISAVAAMILPFAQDSIASLSTRFFVFIWAFSLALGPQISGADREFLRIDLRLKSLNGITLFQKISLFLGTGIVAILFRDQNHEMIYWLALVALGSVICTAGLARHQVNSTLRQMGATVQDLAGTNGPSPWRTLRESFQTFSLWSHLIGVMTGWVQTMDVFCLGLAGTSARVIGLYATALKLANFSMALPLALSNLFSIWMGRRLSSSEGNQLERRVLGKYSFALVGVNFFQGIIIILIAPQIISLLSHGRWGLQEQIEIQNWLKWILGGTLIFCSTFLLSSWFSVRRPIQQLFYRVVLPWGVLAFLLYWAMAHAQSVAAVAKMNIGVSVVYVLLLWMAFQPKSIVDVSCICKEHH